VRLCELGRTPAVDWRSDVLFDTDDDTEQHQQSGTVLMTAAVDRVVVMTRPIVTSRDTYGHVANRNTARSINRLLRRFLLLGLNVRWPRRVLPLVSHVNYAPRALLKNMGETDRQTDRPLHYTYR